MLAAEQFVQLQSQSVTLPVWNHQRRRYYFIVKTDVNGQVFQNGDTSGNTGVEASATNVNLTPPPDLTVSSVSPGASSVLAGHTLDRRCTRSRTMAPARP